MDLTNFDQKEPPKKPEKSKEIELSVIPENSQDSPSLPFFGGPRSDHIIMPRYLLRVAIRGATAIQHYCDVKPVVKMTDTMIHVGGDDFDYIFHSTEVLSLTVERVQ